MFITLLLSFLKNNWQLVAIAAVVAIFAGMFFWIKHQNTELAADATDIATLKHELVDSQTSVKALQDSIDGQNQAIDALAADAEKRALAAKGALAAANASAAALEARSRTLLADPLPKGADVCKATDALINDYLEVNNGK